MRVRVCLKREISLTARKDSVDTILLVQNISLLLCFLAGLLSFFSPCVLPLMPIYLSILSGSVGGEHKAQRPLVNTLSFVVGISTAFFLLGLAFTGLGQLLVHHHDLIVKIGASMILMFGIWVLLPQKFFMQEHRFQLKRPENVNPLSSFLMGFFFSFAWTPCVGPLLSSALIMASSSERAVIGFLYIGIYSLGFIIPFLLFSLGAHKLLTKINNKERFFTGLRKLSGILLIAIAISMFSGWINGLSAKLSQFSGIDVILTQQDNSKADKVGGDSKPAEQAADTHSKTEQRQNTAESSNDDRKHPLAPDFELQGLDGKTYRLSDFKGKRVFLNFWATWCPPCRKEMPDIQQLYENYGKSESYAILTLTNPKSQEFPHNADADQDSIRAFVKSRGFDFPVAFDTSGEVFKMYGIRSFPTTYLVDEEGRIEGYVPSALSYELMEKILTGQALSK